MNIPKNTPMAQMMDGEIARLREINAELLAQLQNLCDRAEEWRASSGYVVNEAIAIKQARVVIAKATQS